MRCPSLTICVTCSGTPAAVRKKSGSSCPTPNWTRCSARQTADGDVPATSDPTLARDLPWPRSDDAGLRSDLLRPGSLPSRPGRTAYPKSQLGGYLRTGADLRRGGLGPGGEYEAGVAAVPHRLQPLLLLGTQVGCERKHGGGAAVG